MDNLVQKLRVRFSLPDSQQADAAGDRRLSPQRSASFKGDKTASWFPRLPAARMPDTIFSSDGSFEAAVAATAYAINKEYPPITTTGSSHRKVHKVPSKRIRLAKDEELKKRPSNAGRISRYFSIKEEKDGEESQDGTGSTTKQQPSATKHPVPGRKLSLEKTTSLPDQGSKRSESTLKRQPTGKPPLGRPDDAGNRGRNQGTAPKPRINGAVSKTIAWENAQRDKIKRRYERTNAKILEWENLKKTDAKRKLGKEENKLELKRARALQKYRADLSRIDGVGGGARAMADERRRNEEAELREKVKQMKSTGRLPKTFLCF